MTNKPSEIATLVDRIYVFNIVLYFMYRKILISLFKKSKRGDTFLIYLVVYDPPISNSFFLTI